MALNWPWAFNMPTIGFVTLILGAIYTIALAVNRLVLSPIAKFPGPKLAALTFW